MRVSLVIDGDASGAEKAAESVSRAIGDLGKESEAISNGIAIGFGRAIGSIEKLTESSKKVSGANDNISGSAMGVVSALTQVAGKALDTDSALSKIPSGSGAIVKGFGDVFKAASTVGAITGAIGLATSAATLFYGVVNERSSLATKLLADNEKQVGLVRDAFSGAAGKAGDFYVQTANVSKLLLTLQAGALRESLQSQVGQVISGATTFGGIEDFLSKTKQVKAEFLPFEDAIFKLQAGFKQGTPDIKAFMDEVARIGNIDPAARKAAGALVALSGEPNKTATGLRAVNAGLAVISGTATETDRKIVGLSKTTGDAANEYERLAKSLAKQAAAQEAEALTVGKSAGEAAKLRGAYLLNEAATQSSIKVTSEYAKEIDDLAGRFGKAAQSAAEASVKSNAAFDRGQLGRTSVESNVAGQLRNAYGDNIEGQLNGALATSIRFNESMRDLKSTTMDLASGAFRDIRTEIQAGTSALDIMGKVGVNAFNKIIDKAGDKALDSLISKLFGAAGSSSGGGLLSGLASIFGFDEGGYTGAGAKHQPAGIVHKGEVVFSQDDISRHGGVAVVEAMRRGVPGYAGGGVVGGAPSPRSYFSASSAGMQAAAQARIPIDINVNVSVDDDGRLSVIAREAGREGGQEAADIRVTVFSRHELPDRVQDIQRNPRNRG